MRGEDESRRTGSSKILPDLDAATIGNIRLTPPPGDATAELNPDLPMPLGPASGGTGRSAEDGKAEWLVAPIPLLKCCAR